MKVVGVGLLLCGFCLAYPPNDAKIVGGFQIDIEEVPYQVSLRLRLPFSGEPFHICGGAIISEYCILTAAHCTKEANPKLMSVRVGSSSIEFGGETFQVSKKTEHPNYDTSTFDYDISILTLLNSITFSHSIKPISLPGSNLKMNAGDRTLVSGWGFIAENIGKAETYLRAVSVPVIDTEKCREMYKKNVPGYPSSITPRMICAGFDEGEKDACQGDSGGPLNYYNPVSGQEELVGIVSWGVGCAVKEYPGVYTNVASLYTWVRQNMK